MLKLFSIYSVFIPLFVGFINFKYLESNARIVLLIVAFASVPHVATIIEHEGSLPTLYYNSYIIVDSILWPVVYLLSSKIQKLRVILLSLLLVNFILVITCIILEGFNKRFYYEMVCVNSIFQIILVSTFFYELNNRNELIILKKETVFWVSIGLLFYTVCTFFVFLFYFRINKYFTESQLNNLWIIHHLFNALMYILFAIGLSIKRIKKDA